MGARERTGSGSLLHVLTGHSNYVYSVAWSPDGSKIAAVGADDRNSVYIYNTADGSLVATSPSDGSPIFDIAWNHVNDKELVSVGKNTVWLWSFDAGKLSKKRISDNTYICCSYSNCYW